MTTYAPPTADDASSLFPRKRWSRSECEFLVNSGLLEEGHFELIEGDIVSKMGQSRYHIFVVTALVRMLSSIFDPASVQCQAPVGIGALDPYNDPEPDASVLRGTVGQYLSREPDPRTDVLLVAEAALSTVRGDRTIKASLYARYGIPEYWLVDIAARQLVVFRQPSAEGYGQEITLTDAQSIAPLSAPQSAVAVRDLLP